ncbi:Protein kinase domain [Trypanosoma melophagium]|uniref:Protein kinase domain n=1 Tax=Trypanosoma melophagium TaxID=715481 RepID=UPI00351A536E|nr:Protein kinase domain [Trypanosoma melophagium]
MSEHLRRRIEELKSRKATTEDSAASLSSTTVSTSISTVPTTTTTTTTTTSARVAATVAPSTYSPPLSSTSTGKPTASIPISNLPPAFVSPHGAVVKYRDTVNDPLCAKFTTKSAVKLFETVLKFHKSNTRRKRERSPDVGNDTETQEVQEQQEKESDGDHILEIKNTKQEEHVANTNSHISTIISYFLPEVGERCFNFSEEKRLKGENTNKGTPLSSHSTITDIISNNCKKDLGHILVSGKRRLPCRSVEEYEPRARIAQGVYGVVISAVETKPSTIPGGKLDNSKEMEKYALKQVKKQWLEESRIGFPPYLLREFDLLLRLRHPNIVRAREVVIQEKIQETTKQTRIIAGTGTGVGVGGGGGGEEGTINSHAVKNAISLHEMTDERSVEKNNNNMINGNSIISNNSNNNNNDNNIDNNSNNNKNKNMKNNNINNNGENNGIIASNQDKVNIDGIQSRHQGTDEWKTVYLVMEYCPYDLKSFLSLHNERGVYLHLSSRNKHPDARKNFLSRVKCIMQQLFQALSFLHEHRILHRDIKTSNILISPQGIVKLCDFGLGRLYTEGQELTANVVTLIYRAPELHFGVRDYSHKMDVWSLGCIMAELFLKLPLFHAEEENKHFAAICDIIGIPTEETFSGLYKMPELARMMRTLTRFNRENTLRQVFEKSRHAGASTLPESGFDLLQRILRWNPIERISAREALKHPFFHEEPLACEPAELLRPMPTATAPSSAAISTSTGEGKRGVDTAPPGESSIGEAVKQQQPPTASVQKSEDIGGDERGAIPQMTHTATNTSPSTNTTATNTTTTTNICGNNNTVADDRSLLSEKKPEQVLSRDLNPQNDAQRVVRENSMEQSNQNSGYTSPSEY